MSKPRVKPDLCVHLCTHCEHDAESSCLEKPSADVEFTPACLQPYHSGAWDSDAGPWKWLMEFAVAGVACNAFNWLFHNPYCGLLFQCGCTFNYPLITPKSDAGWGPCNVHNARKPWCPWCRSPQDHPNWAWTVSNWFVVGLMLVAYIIVRGPCTHVCMLYDHAIPHPSSLHTNTYHDSLSSHD